jgi:signal transduction histidine kinase
MGAVVDKKFHLNNDLNYVPAYIKSIFSNLLSNAIKYHEQERKLKISIKTWKIQNGISFSFSDNGKGIDLEKNGKILFSPFVRFSKEIEGKGIGLHIIKNMVESNGGSIKVESTLGRGTEFIFSLVEY